VNVTIFILPLLHMIDSVELGRGEDRAFLRMGPALVAKEATGSRDRGRRRRDRWGGWPINYGGYRGTLNHLELRRYRWEAYSIRLAHMRSIVP
jgi:hypothetical protein